MKVCSVTAFLLLFGVRLCFALTGGPSMPEYLSFEPDASGGGVDLTPGEEAK